MMFNDSHILCAPHFWTNPYTNQQPPTGAKLSICSAHRHQPEDVAELVIDPDMNEYERPMASLNMCWNLFGMLISLFVHGQLNSQSTTWLSLRIYGCWCIFMVHVTRFGLDIALLRLSKDSHPKPRAIPGWTQYPIPQTSPDGSPHCCVALLKRNLYWKIWKLNPLNPAESGHFLPCPAMGKHLSNQEYGFVQWLWLISIHKLWLKCGYQCDLKLTWVT